MKILLDFLPILLFFAVFKYGESNPEAAAAFASQHLGFMVSGGVVGAKEAPVLLATLVVIAASVVQIAVLLLRGKKVDTMLWVSLVLVTVLGGATIWFHSDAFIKWKPTALYWITALAFWASQTFFNKNLLHTMMGGQLELPAPIWRRLNLGWVIFFLSMGALNLYVAFYFSFSTWVNFKVFGVMGLMVVFMVAQGVYLSRHLKHQDAAPSAGKDSA